MAQKRIEQFLFDNRDLLSQSEHLISRQFHSSLDDTQDNIFQNFCGLQGYGSAIKLHQYQRVGVSWLLSHCNARVSCILADEMGLGKTIQCITCLHALTRSQYALSSSDFRPALIVCPLSVVGTWTTEIHHFFPHLLAVPFVGTKEKRETIKLAWKEKSNTYADQSFLSAGTSPIMHTTMHENGGLCKKSNVRASTESCPDLVTVVVKVGENDNDASKKGAGAKRGSAVGDECFPWSTDNAPFHLLITTYEIFLVESGFLQKIQWSCLVVDEAQRLKNPTARLCQTLLRNPFRSLMKIFLTERLLPYNLATHIASFFFTAQLASSPSLLTYSRASFETIIASTANHTRFSPTHHSRVLDLWSLFHILHPHIFQNAKEDLPIFGHSTSNPVTRPTPLLLKVLNLLLLRRRQKQIPHAAFWLPPKHTITLIVPLTKLQRHLYLWLLTKDSIQLQAAIEASLKPFSTPFNFPSSASLPQWSCSDVLGRLRRCSNHPYLIPRIEPEPFMEGDHLINASGKLIVLDKLIEYFSTVEPSSDPLLSATPSKIGHRFLIFSGSTQMLDIVQDYLHWRNRGCERLDGSVRGDEREKAIRRYQTEDSGHSIFLLSTRAGGTGLNLTQASVVIFLDCDWNPQVDEQALARAFRQGQKNVVHVFRLISKNTVDELIFKRTRRKTFTTKTLLQENDVEPAPLSIDLFASIANLARAEECQCQPHTATTQKHYQ